VFYVLTRRQEGGRREGRLDRGMGRRHRAIFKAGNPSLKYEYGPVPSQFPSSFTEA